MKTDNQPNENSTFTSDEFKELVQFFLILRLFQGQGDTLVDTLEPNNYLNNPENELKETME